jgi:RHS repeat-associated protein
MDAKNMNRSSAFTSSLAPAAIDTSTASRLPQWCLPRWLVAWAAALASLLLTATATACPADPGGAPNKPGQCAGAGNPINVMTGNKYQREDDMPALPGVLGLEIVRHYNSAFSKPDQPNGVLGRGWRLSYETELVDRWGRIQVLQADGGRVVFDRDPKAPTGCSTLDPASGTMSIGSQRDGRPDYTWTWTDGRKLHFNAAGKLDRITAPTGETVRLLYDNQNVLVRVIDPQGRSLNLVYYDRHIPNQFHGVQFIDTPVGRFGYEYGSALPKGAGLFDKRQLLANLVRVRLPDHFDPDQKAHALSSRGTTRSTLSRIYHHEDPRSPWLMTGISIETPGADGKPVTTRYSTYGYDDTGRAILSTHAGNVDKVTLDNHEAGKTVLTNSLGQKTVYRYAVIADEFRLLEVRGAGCALCGEPNVRYRYDDAGRLTEMTKLSESGEPVAGTRVERDKLGRVTRVGKIVYRHGKAEPAQLQVRLEYQGGGYAPALVARPSVVPGKELVTRIDYNAAGQPLRVTESGWVPTADGKQAAAGIERTVRYRYATIDGRSLLTEIDGPLPNGKTNSPADSDVTILEYDHRPVASVAASSGGLAQYERRDGLLTRVIAPGGLVTEVLERDAALRPTRLRTTDGDLEQAMSVTSNWRGAPLHLELAAGTLRWKLDYEYDALGQVAAVTMPGSLHTVFRYDDAGRRALTVLPDGSGIRNEQDTEDRIVRTTRLLDALAGGGTGLSALRFTYDHAEDKPGKLAEVGDTAGLIKRYGYDELGRLATARSALGITTAFAYDAAGLLASRTDAAGSPDAASLGLAYDLAGHATKITAGNGVKTLRRYDDFGRKVMEADPDHGITIFRHDPAGHVVARIDESLVATRFTYDHAGRLVAMGADKEPNLVQYRYRGRQLQGMVSTPDGKPEHATERTDYERDAFGRVTRETRWLANVAPHAAAGPGFSFVTTSEYDEAGRLVSQTLPDRHRLQYRYAPADVGKASARRPGQLEAILFDDDVVVTDVEQTIAGGLTGYTMGNGARQQISLDSRGRIEQLQVLAGAAEPAGWWRRITAWFSGSKGNGDALFYRQVNHYDADGRITRIDRQMPSAETGRVQIALGDTYAYDHMNRLIGILSSDGTDTRYAYDKGGNRVFETVGTTRGDGLHGTISDGALGQTVNRYAYAPGTNRLIAITSGQSDIDTGAVAAPRNATEAAQLIRDAWFYHATGVPLAQLVGTDRGDHANRRIVYNSAKRPIEVYINEQLVARYHYNVQGERIAKIVYATRRPLTAVSYQQGHDQGDTSYSLYREQRLAAETDGAGRIAAHYVYLCGKPVAKIEMDVNDSRAHRFWKAITMRNVPDASDTRARIYAVVTDHLGMPRQVMDERQHVVWQANTTAFGQTRVTYAEAVGTNAQPFVMNLRLPGQVFDAATNLNYNYLRDYDPEVGRYTTPDPAGLGGGLNPYAYVSNDPLTNIDPLGLFQSDIHYYMTFFLAVVAGVNPEEARVIALAAQYIDDNPDTSPLNVSVWTGLTDEHRARLLTYHFTMVPSAINPATGLVSGIKDDIFLGYGTPPSDPRYTNIPENAQLKNLSAAVATAGQATNLANSRCTQLQFFGEYLHAFEDTFAHRDSKDMPFALDTGLGHGIYGSNPDYTYNHSTNSPRGGGSVWSTNEARTLEAEKEVFAKMSAWADPSKAKKIEDIEKTLKDFNKIQESEGDGETTEERQRGYPTKIGLLQSALKKLGYTGIDITQAGQKSFNTQTAAQNRTTYLHDKNGKALDQKLYRGTILPK